MLSPKVKLSLVNVLGGITLASIASYFFALGRAVLGSDPEWAEFFASNVLWFLYVPFTLGLVYFFARVQIARHLLEQDALDEVIAWTRPRLGYNFWMRGKREILIQRVVLAQAHMRRLEFEQAREVLWLDEPLPQKARELLELYVWRALWGLRQEDLVKARAALDSGREIEKPANFRAQLLALDAMRALRAGQHDEVRGLLEESRWLEKTWMADWVQALWVSQDGAARDRREDVLAKHDALHNTLARVVPGALPEYLMSLAVLVEQDDRTRARSLREQAHEYVVHGATDPRSAWIVARQEEE